MSGPEARGTGPAQESPASSRATSRKTGRDIAEIDRGGWRPPVFRARAAVYVDGFNLYHALDDLKRPYLKWLDIPGLMRGVIPRSQVLKRSVWCTAFKPTSRDRQIRHAAYISALEARGVNCMLGHFVAHTNGCNACGHRWTSWTEKQGDVNMALSVLNDAHANLFDVAYLITADGDHAATARVLKQQFPHKRVVSVAPPGRGHNRYILEWCDAKLSLTNAHVEQALLPAVVRGRGRTVVRPSPYDPPDLPRQRRHLVLVSSQ
jgi:hypothetical protein